ncbi:type IV secretory system conjugative DNA transfer family protein [Acinetobacter gerneri]|uniref:TraD/TraG TraM recognition site domain-containing protein n=1 Tax=Acinetobacter gerneri DSM 14967 = CIP 107464 = MTCC 9824 TaxID=1120926 RepID=N8YFL2_9GAMM|nr:type IV secretory system conjugative DNA transfer family protein [Acinetobacter gerneri]ENV35476.1 hypothetical protein F960_00283 [Acinetobacter gerneri DSM 14967 = CIP 107464 = MTCC 9824]EPR82495.1 TraG [Acinetobacter gerneri DSM 14967 = CIP 107464 = MTCC 9824]
MNKLLLASLVALCATGANAQGMAERTCKFEDATILANPTPDNLDSRHKLYEKYRILEADYAAADQYFLGKDCAKVEDAITRIVQIEKPILQVIAEDDFNAQEKLNNDTVNSIKAMLDSGNQTSVFNALEMMEGYLARGEYALAGKGLEQCQNNYGEAVRWRYQPCNPFPAIQQSQARELKRLGLHVDDTPSAIYTALASQYKDGTDEEKQKIQQFASSNIFEILPHNILGKISQLNAYNAVANQKEMRTAEKTKKIAENSTIVGNFTSTGERLKTAIWGWLGNAVMWAIICMILFRLPFISNKHRQNLVGLFPHIMITLLPFYAVYVAFGGLITPIIKDWPSWVSWCAIIFGFVPCVRLSKRLFPNLRLPALSFLKGKANKVTNNTVAADGLHGSAQWSNGVTAVDNGRMLMTGRVFKDSFGFALGRVTDKIPEKYDVDTRLRYMGHVMTIAPTGSGKGVGLVTPTLLEYPGSTIVLDPKGENYAITARYRRDVLGHKIYAIDPYNVLKGLGIEANVCSFNWLDYIDINSPDVVNQSSLIADMIVVAEGNSSDSSDHFNESAKSFLRGLLVHVASFPIEKRNMREVRRLVSETTPEEWDNLLIDMQLNEAGHNMAIRAANSLMATPEKEQGSILSTLRRHTAFLDDPRITDTLAHSDFNLRQLKREKMTVYLVMPPNLLEINKSFLRTAFGLALDGITSVTDKPEHKVLFLFDEFAQLGRMKTIEKALSIIRSYDARFWFIFQDISQLKDNYGSAWNTFISNCGATQYFGVGDYDTAKYVSDTLGKTTVEYSTSSQNSGTSMGGMNVNSSSGDGLSQQFTARDLMTPEEVSKLPSDKVIVMISGKGEAPYLLDRITYHEDAAYDGSYDPNPYEKG